MLTYLLLNIGSIAYPLYASFDKRLNFYKKWRYALPGILLTAAFFIFWDIIFTQRGVWSFNEEYLIGLYFYNLPIEEWLFFIAIPFACLFIYEVVKYYFPNPEFNISLPIVFIVGLLAGLGIVNYDKLYTFYACIFTAGFLLLHYFMFKGKYLRHFLIAYGFHLIPFLLVNGVLTSLPVVSYNDMHNLQIRIITIPIEDAIYSMLLLLMNITFYEILYNKRKPIVSQLVKQL
ncbi:MAG: lycopene cyclase domain-containing protein [Cytophagaceae bacterium]